MAGRSRVSFDQIVRYADMFSAMGTEARRRIMRLLLSAHPEGMIVGELQQESTFPPLPCISLGKFIRFSWPGTAPVSACVRLCSTAKSIQTHHRRGSFHLTRHPGVNFEVGTILLDFLEGHWQTQANDGSSFVANCYPYCSDNVIAVLPRSFSLPSTQVS
jgi:hypothetical protein